MISQLKALTFFSVLVMGAVGVFVVCIWKIIKLFALYKMETRVEELETIFKDENGKSTDLREVLTHISPREARTLRRLSYLAGFDKRKCSDISCGSAKVSDGPLALLKGLGSPKMRKLSSLSNKIGSLSSNFQNKNSLTVNVPLPDNSQRTQGPPTTDNEVSSPSSLSPNIPTSSSAPTNPSVERSPVQPRFRHNPHCAVHGDEILIHENTRPWSSEFLLLPPPLPRIINRNVAVNTENTQLNSIVVPTVPLHPGYLCPCQLMLVKRTVVDGNSESMRYLIDSPPDAFSDERHLRVEEDDNDDEEEDIDDDDESDLNHKEDLLFSKK